MLQVSYFPNSQVQDCGRAKHLRDTGKAQLDPGTKLPHIHNPPNHNLMTALLHFLFTNELILSCVYALQAT